MCVVLCCVALLCLLTYSISQYPSPYTLTHNKSVNILVVQPLRSFGKVENKNEIYWEGLAECYNRGLVKNVGVCNYGPTLVEECQKALAKHGVPLASNQITFSLLGRHNGSQETVT